MEGKAVVQKQEAEKVPMEMGSSGGVIEGQVTEPLAWMLKAIKIPINAPQFLIIIMQENANLDHSEIGSIEVATAMVFVQSQLPQKVFSSISNKVKDDGPSFELTFQFSTSLPFNSFKADSLNYNEVALYLRQMLAFKRIADPLMLTILHSRILFLPDANLHRAPLLQKLHEVLSKHYNILQPGDALNKAVCIYDDAVRITREDDPMKAVYLNDLGSSLFERFEQSGDHLDIAKSISMCENAVQHTPDSHNSKATRLTNLGNSLWAQFRHLGDLADINKAITAYENALRLTPNGHPDQPAYLNNLGAALFYRHEQLGDLADMNKSILNYETATEHTMNHDSNKSKYLINLGEALLFRFKRFGNLADINKAILIQENAVQLTSDSDSNKGGYLSNLGKSLCHRFNQLGNLSDIHRSVSCQENAVQFTPNNHPDMYIHLYHLGVSLESRFKQLGNTNDLNKSIEVFEKAVQLISSLNPTKPLCLKSLGNSLCKRFIKLVTPDDINRSISLLQEAVQLIPDSHPRKASHLNSLNKALLCRYRHLHISADLNKVYPNFSSAAQSLAGPPADRFTACIAWALYARAMKHSSLLDAYKTAINIVPQLAWLGLSIDDRYYQLKQAEHVVRDAAAAAIGAGQHHTALEWLEQGRSVIWNQLFQLRTPLDDLKQVQPDLADKLIEVSKNLEAVGTSEVVASGSNQYSINSMAQRCHDLALKQEEIVRQIRAIQGFERFLLPKTLSELVSAAHAGPVVILNVSKIRCDALVITSKSDTVLHVPLSNLTYKDAQELHKSLRNLLFSYGRSILSEADRAGSSVPVIEDPEMEFQSILSTLWIDIVKPVLDALCYRIPESNQLSRIWWCPTGPVSFLPIHAAGLYGANMSLGSKLSDFVVSSYTSTLSALIESLKASNRVQKKLQLLLVAQPSADGQRFLPGTQQELDIIQKHAQRFSVSKLLGNDATVKNVATELKKCNWVHFACHGVQDTLHPTKSALLLEGNSRLTLTEISKLSFPNACLAFLSACQTATGTEHVSEEAAHLAAGMQSAGYHGVIATLWSILDRDAPLIADAVYAHLLNEEHPDPTQAAHALHFAVQKLCNNSGNNSFFSWVPFIHIGV